MPLVVRSGSALTMNIQNEVIAFVDRMAVSEIVENLLSNAIKYGREQADRNRFDGVQPKWLR